LRVQRQNALILRQILRLIVVVAAAAIAVLLGVGVMVVPLVPAFLLLLAEFVLDYLVSTVLLAFGDPLVFLIAVVMLVKDAVFPLVAAFVLAFAELVLDYLISAVLLAFGDPPVFLIVIILETNADLLSIPTIARRGGLPPGGRACGAGSPGGSCGIRRSRGAGACGLLACPEGISVF
jgi:hypothetical protein